VDSEVKDFAEAFVAAIFLVAMVIWTTKAVVEVLR
jgi:hypothetical protein